MLAVSDRRMVHERLRAVSTPEGKPYVDRWLQARVKIWDGVDAAVAAIPPRAPWWKRPFKRLGASIAKRWAALRGKS